MGRKFYPDLTIDQILQEFQQIDPDIYDLQEYRQILTEGLSHLKTKNENQKVLNIGQLIIRPSLFKAPMSAIQQSLSQSIQASNTPEALFKEVQSRGILPTSLTYEQLVEQIKANSITNKGDFSEYVPDLAVIFLNTLKGLETTISYPQASSSTSASISTSTSTAKKSKKIKKPRKKSGYDLFRADPQTKQKVKELKEQLKAQPEYAELSGIKLYNTVLQQLWNEPGVKEQWNQKAQAL